MALVRHSECSVRPLYQRYCLNLALLLYPVSVVFSCRPPNMSLCWGTSACVLWGKFVPRISDVKCSRSLVNINTLTCTLIKTSNCPVWCYFLVKKLRNQILFHHFLADAVPNIVICLPGLFHKFGRKFLTNVCHKHDVFLT